MSKPKDKPLTLGSATVGPVRVLTMKDIIEVPDGVDKDAVAAKLEKHATVHRYGSYSAAALGRRNVAITPIWIRGDGSIPWEHPPIEEAIRQAAEATAQEFLAADDAIRQAAEGAAQAAADLAQEFQDGARKSARTAAMWTWDALGNFAEHQAPPVMDAVEIALREEAEANAKTAQERRSAELAREAAETAETKNNPRDWIAREMRPHLVELRARMRLAVDLRVWTRLPADEPPDAVAAAKVADNLLADYLESELRAPSVATGIRGSIDERQARARQHDTDGDEERGRAWMLWFRPEGNPPIGPFPFLTLLAIAVWRAVVRPALEEERAKRARELDEQAKHTTGLTQPLFGRVADLNRPGSVAIDGDVLEVISSTAVRAEIRLPVGTGRETAKRAIRALGKVPYHLSLEALLSNAHRDYWNKVPEAGRFVFEGGADLAGFALGKSKRDCRQLTAEYEDAARALMLTFQNPHAPGHWVSLAGGEVRPGRGRRPGRIIIDLTSVAMPTYLKTLPDKGLREREARRLVPFTKPPATLDKANRVKGPQLWFWARLVARIREHAEEAFLQKGVRLTWQNLESIAEAAGLAAKWVRPLVALWLETGDLVSPTRSRYHLGGKHEEARASINRYGRRAEEGRRGILPPEKRRKPRKSKKN